MRSQHRWQSRQTSAFSGLLWGVLAGYARRITPTALAGRALAVASIGTPVGLPVGTPLDPWLGTTADWRWAFAALTLLTVITLVLARTIERDAPRPGRRQRSPPSRSSSP